jgi:hypothetical protein
VVTRFYDDVVVGAVSFVCLRNQLLEEPPWVGRNYQNGHTGVFLVPTKRVNAVFPRGFTVELIRTKRHRALSSKTTHLPPAIGNTNTATNE